MTQTLASTPEEIVAGSWVPPQDLKEHSDAPIPPDADFFATLGRSGQAAVHEGTPQTVFEERKAF